MNRTLTCLILACLISFSSWSQTTNTVGSILFDPALAAPGYTLIYPHNQPHAMLLNLCGEVVHQWTNDDDRRPGNTAYLRPNGNLIWTHRSSNVTADAIWSGGGGSTIEVKSWDNESIWSYTLNDSTGRFHHDIAPLGNGNILAIAWEKIDSLECILAGRDPNNLEDGELWSERIVEIEPDGTGGGQMVWEWRAWNHLIQDMDSTLSNYGVVADHPERININHGSASTVSADWLHMNSIDYNPNTGHLLVSIPSFDEIWVIDRNNGDDGVQWRWGNPEAYGMDAPQLLHYQHSALWLDAPYLQNSTDFGKIAVFNNRNPGVTGPYSSAHLIDVAFNDSLGAYEMIDGLFSPADFDWTWTAPTPTDFYSSGLSNFDRLANGNNLLISGRTGEIFEFTAEGDTAWYYRLPLQNGMPVAQGAELNINANLLFRAQRYPAGFPAFSGLSLSDGLVLELEPSPLDVCQPCTMELDLTETGTGWETSIEGGSEPYSVSWTLPNGEVICSEVDLLIDGPCQEALTNLPEGSVIFVEVTDASGCSVLQQVNWTWTSVEAHHAKCNLFPNPAMDYVMLGNLPGNVQLILRNAMGEIVLRGPLTSGASLERWNLPLLPSGWYIMEAGTKRLPLLIAPH